MPMSDCYNDGISYSPCEEKVLQIAEKEYSKNGYAYSIKTKNQDGTYTVSVMKENSTSVTCYLAVNPETNQAQVYEITNEIVEN